MLKALIQSLTRAQVVNLSCKKNMHACMHTQLQSCITRDWQDDDDETLSTPGSFASGVVSEAPAESAPVGVSSPRAEQPVEASENPSCSDVGPGLNTVTATSETSGVELGCLKDESVEDGDKPGGAELMRNLATPMKNSNSNACAFLKITMHACMHACIYIPDPCMHDENMYKANLCLRLQLQAR